MKPSEKNIVQIGQIVALPIDKKSKKSEYICRFK